MSTRRPEADWAGGPGHEETSLVEQIKLLAEAMADTAVTELELVDSGLEIRLQRQAHTAGAAGQVVYAVAPGVIPAGVPAAVPSAAPAPTTPEAPSAPAEVTLAVMAPLTGVFYSSPSPAQPAFVKIGDLVQPGQVVCMVEAMKVFNEIKTEIGGAVVAIPPKNGQLVKKGDPLIRIKPH